MLKNSKQLKMLSISLCIGLTSCGHVTVYNRRVFADLGKYGSHYAETLTDKTGDVSKAEWDKLRVGMLCMNSQAYTDAETAIDQACILLNCDFETRESLRKALDRVRPVKQRSLEARDLFLREEMI